MSDIMRYATRAAAEAALSRVMQTNPQRWYAGPRREGSGWVFDEVPGELVADADATNAAGARQAALERVQREREARRDMQPMQAGGLFDDVRRATRDLFEGDQ